MNNKISIGVIGAGSIGTETIKLSKFIIPNEAWEEINQLPYSTHDVEAARQYKPG